MKSLEKTPHTGLDMNLRQKQGKTNFRQRFDRTQWFWVPSTLQSINREGELHLLVEELTLDREQF